MRTQVVFYTLLLSFFSAAERVAAQLFSFGLKGGVPLLEPARTNNISWVNDESRRYTFGPAIEFRLPDNFSVEANLLYSRIGSTSNFLDTYVSRTRSHSVELPLLGKYTFMPESRTWRPFVSSGFAFRKIWSVTAGTYPNFDPAGNVIGNAAFRSGSRSGLHVGAVFGGGVRLKTKLFDIVPEFRYVRWGAGTGTVTNANQAGFLVGIHF
ncbi:MAG: porin family protein [Bryobacteraceae bacterium]